LSTRSIIHAETILGHLFNFLMDQGYSRFNPCRSLPKGRQGQGGFKGHRALSTSQWQFMRGWLDRQVQNSQGSKQLAWLRLRLMVVLLYVTGIRLHELAQATRTDVVLIERDGKNQYWLQVLGKGHKQREVPLPPKTYQLLVETYVRLTQRNWRTLPGHYPLITSLRGTVEKSLVPKAIYTALKTGFQLAADELQQSDPESAEKLRQVTTHWLRHTHGTHAVDRQIPLTVIRDNLGHSSLAVTSQYVHADNDQRHQAMVKWEEDG